MSLSYGRRLVDQFFLVSGSPLGPMARFYPYPFFLLRAPSLTRGRVCNLQRNRWLVRSVRTNNHTLPSHLRLCSLFVASYDSQGLRWRYSNPPPHRALKNRTNVREAWWPNVLSYNTHCIENEKNKSSHKDTQAARWCHNHSCISSKWGK
jgi:hypothetical protein